MACSFEFRRSNQGAGATMIGKTHWVVVAVCICLLSLATFHLLHSAKTIIMSIFTLISAIVMCILAIEEQRDGQEPKSRLMTRLMIAAEAALVRMRN
jgi:hypothetical protein